MFEVRFYINYYIRAIIITYNNNNNGDDDNNSNEFQVVTTK